MYVLIFFFFWKNTEMIELQSFKVSQQKKKLRYS